ncbi:Transmembrane protein 56-B [Glycine soja]
MELTSSFGLTFFYDYATPSKVVLWLASIFSGIILCVLVYTSTAILSSLLFKGYGKLSSAEKIEWNNRGFSTFHALFVSSASFYLLILSDVFNVNSHGDVVINRSSTLSDAVLGISIGYFLTDLAMILWNFPALGGTWILLALRAPNFTFGMASHCSLGGCKDFPVHVPILPHRDPLCRGEGDLSIWFLHLDYGAFCVGSAEHILVLEDCKGHG